MSYTYTFRVKATGEIHTAKPSWRAGTDLVTFEGVGTFVNWVDSGEPEWELLATNWGSFRELVETELPEFDNAVIADRAEFINWEAIARKHLAGLEWVLLPDGRITAFEPGTTEATRQALKEAT